MNLEGGSIDVVISEYLLPTDSGYFRIHGYIRSDTIKEPTEHLFTYFMCTSTEASTAEDDIHEINVNGRIVKKGKLSVLKQGSHILPIVVRCKMNDGHTSIIHGVLFDKCARLVNSFDDVRVASINANGKLNFRFGTIEVHLPNAEIIRKEDI